MTEKFEQPLNSRMCVGFLSLPKFTYVKNKNRRFTRRKIAARYARAAYAPYLRRPVKTIS